MATNPHIYVSSVHGTNTGASDTSYASQQTGAMTSLTAGNVYDNLESAIVGASPSDGDTIYIADDHAASYALAVDTIVNSGGAASSAGLRIISVDASNVDQYSPGASDIVTSANEWILDNSGFIAGLTIGTDHDTFRFYADAHWTIQDCTIKCIGSGDIGISMEASATVRLINTDIDTADAGANPMTINAASGYIYWHGGSLTGTPTTGNFFQSNSRGTVYIEGVDLSNHSGTLVKSVFTADSPTYITLKNCKLNDSLSVLFTTPGAIHNRYEMYNVDDSSDAYHRFQVTTAMGEVKNNDATYVTATESWYEGSVKSSIEVTTESLCSHVNPLWFELPAQYVNLADTSTIVIDLVSNITLTDTDIAAFLVYPDATTAVTPRWVTSGATVGSGNYGIDPLSAGTELETSPLDGDSWTGEPASPKYYRLTLETSATPGQATAPVIRIEVYKPSIDGTTNKLFINSEIGVL